MAPPISASRANYGVFFMSYSKKKIGDISRAHYIMIQHIALCLLTMFFVSHRVFAVTCLSSSWLNVHGDVMIRKRFRHYSDVIMSGMASQITSLTIVYSTVYSGADEWKHQSSASLAFVRGIHRWPVNSPHKGPVTRKMFPFDDVIIAFLVIREERHYNDHLTSR